MFGIQLRKPAESLCEAREGADGHQYTGRVVRRKRLLSLFSPGEVYSLEVVGPNGRKATRRIGTSQVYFDDDSYLAGLDPTLVESDVRLKLLEFNRAGLVAAVSEVTSISHLGSNGPPIVTERPYVFVLPREKFPGYRAR